MNQLKDAIEKAKENENKLILIVGLPGSGKSKLIHEYSKDSGIPILDLDNIFKDTNNNIAEVMDNFLVTYNKDVLLLDNKKILYTKDSNIDMLSFFKNLAEKLVVVATWNGKVDNNKLIHIRSKLPTDLTYSLDNEQLTIIQKN
ncbi:BREX-3 system P-loop-containing protein BrxF [Thomasclavelia spiroformis]|jgi:chromosomal replication initiation ATPase DnaA|uniref:BREX-3 system P-loop-containing protein BrxF n=1 Tax=Thomasclavelia spiroformis TaxID=29348 RepID=UPI00241E86B1|nr:BREX-3 system P-loop-containing protein BrxF [Thomasclavelia spiroformis]MBS6115039.1 BREX-3 system P-loop-containing protein BrxF [Thomasclavelia spiroformis]MEE0442205.1 BREX-3 system P-loop-containing protein BrxF [Thomasclavelia sp.]